LIRQRRKPWWDAEDMGPGDCGRRGREAGRLGKVLDVGGILTDHGMARNSAELVPCPF
jgi:hypothetical protein